MLKFRECSNIYWCNHLNRQYVKQSSVGSWELLSSYVKNHHGNEIYHDSGRKRPNEVLPSLEFWICLRTNIVGNILAGL